MASAAEIDEYLSKSINGFQDHPADTPFLEGYEAGLLQLRRLIDQNLADIGKLTEPELIELCDTLDPDFRDGFLSAWTDIHEYLASIEQGGLPSPSIDSFKAFSRRFETAVDQELVHFGVNA